MIERIYNYMTGHNMIEEGGCILAAVSGGADSMCLLEVLRELQGRAGLRLKVFHVHHGLRESADGDLRYVAEYCEERGIPFEAAYVDAAGFAAGSGLSVEEAARHLRYEALEQAADRWEQEMLSSGRATAEESSGRTAEEAAPATGHAAAKTPAGHKGKCHIAVAHHIEDQAETVLFNLVRGSRLTGLRGMLPVNGRIIRPLLACSRREIEEFLKERGISWREDETNEDIRYSRNLLRREVMPLLGQINAGAGEHIARAAEEAAQTEEFLREVTEKAYRECRTSECPSDESRTHGGLSDEGRMRECPSDEIRTRDSLPDKSRARGDYLECISVPALMRQPPLIRRRVVYGVIADAAGKKKDLQDVHVQAVLRLAQKNGNGRLDLFGGVRVEKVYDKLLFSAGGQQDTVRAAEAAARRWPSDAGEYRCRVFDFDGDMASVSRNLYTKWFDYDKIGALPIFRTRREGDRITLDESGRSKTIARYMIDAKVPAQLRGRIVLPAVGSEILWVPAGMVFASDAETGSSSDSGRMSAAYLVSSHTGRILEISWEPGNGPDF